MNIAFIYHSARWSLHACWTTVRSLRILLAVSFLSGCTVGTQTTAVVSPKKTVVCETTSYVAESAAIEFDKRGVLIRHEYEGGTGGHILESFEVKRGQGKVVLEYIHQSLRKIPKFKSVKYDMELLEGTEADETDTLLWFHVDTSENPLCV